MYCGKCGAEISEIAKFCPKCGAQVAQPTNPVHVQTVSAAVPTAPVKKKKKGIAIVAVLAVIAIVVSAIWGVTSAFGEPEDAETVSVKYADAAFDLNFDAMNRYMAIPYDKMLADLQKVFETNLKSGEENGMSQEMLDGIKERIDFLANGKAKKMFDQVGGLLSENRKETFGKDYQRSVDVLYQIELSDTERTEFLEELKSGFESINSNMGGTGSQIKISNYFPFNKVDAVYQVTCEIYEEGSEDVRTTEVEFKLLEIDGEYKTFDGMFGGGSSVLDYIDMSGIDFSELDEEFRVIFGF